MNMLTGVKRGHSGQWWCFRSVGQERLLGGGDSKNKKEREKIRHAKSRTIHYLSVLDAKSPKPRRQLGHAPSSLSHLLLAQLFLELWQHRSNFCSIFILPMCSHLFSSV